ncbi:MAG: imidazoleglycerol-phosphate dehydratase HisB [Clostridia bacterium]|nr:imidazoleglycerol-phosphate dehydratase HisB [Oscillospiraceae bacterium]MBR6693633.1 imidazoleglycerol-phosphate dehydratase HisB [Clostridia bacterium]
MRTSRIDRKTAETDISLNINIDGRGESKINSGCGFLDHMLTLFAKHGRFDLELVCKGDCEVDYHHTTEDIGIALGQAFREALGNKAGIIRYGHTILPMDDALIISAIDFSGRAYLGYDVDLLTEKVGDFDTELVKEFWYGFVRTSECNLHIMEVVGENSHHIIEGIYKSVARSIKTAITIEERFKDDIPSTKGVL